MPPQILQGAGVLGVDLQQPFVGLAGERGPAQVLIVDLGQPRQDRFLLARPAGHHLDLALQHLGQPIELPGIGAECLQRLQRLGRPGIERHRPVEQHPSVGRQVEPLAQDLGCRHQRRRALDLAGADPNIVGGGNQGARGGVWIALPGEELDQPPPGGSHQRTRGGVVDADLQRRQRALFLAALFVGHREQVSHLGARRSLGCRVERAPERRDLVGVVGFEIGCLGLRSGRPAERDAAGRDAGGAQPKLAAVGEPESIGDEDLVERGRQRIDLEGAVARGRCAEHRRQRRPHVARARLSAIDGDPQLAPLSRAEAETRREPRPAAVARVRLTGEHQVAGLQRDAHRDGRGLRRCDATFDPRAVDDQRGGAQVTAAVAELGDGQRLARAGPLDLQALHHDRTEVAGGDRQDRPAVHQGEGHRRRGVGHPGFPSLRTERGEGRRARTPAARCRRRT